MEQVSAQIGDARSEESVGHGLQRKGFGLIEAFTCAMPHQKGRPFYRQILRFFAGTFGSRIIELRGLEHLAIENDPFILAMNHTQKLEALFIPSTIGCVRKGKLVRFIADWNLQLIPGIRPIYRAGQVILLDRKPARPAFLNIFRPWLTDKEPAFEAAGRMLREGHSIGFFPEGTTNREPRKLLRGFNGAATLSLTEGIPVVPAGVRFPEHRSDKPIREFERMIIEFGTPMPAPEKTEKPNRRLVHQWHGDIMLGIARLSGKSWQPMASRKKHV